MRQLLRFSISGVIGFIITAALFIGMLSLLNGNKPATSSTETQVNFSFIKDFKEPKVIPPRVTEPPVQQEVKQPPAAPTFNVDVNNDPTIPIPVTGTKGTQLNILDLIALPGTSGGSGYSPESQGGVKVAIAPVYPQPALVSRTEGWVKVNISVNKFGTVNSVSVVESKPARIFNAVTRKAVMKWKFHPKTIDGKAIPFIATQTIEFKLDQ